MAIKLIQCCLPNDCGNECCLPNDCFFGYENNGSSPRACGLTIYYLYAFSDGYLYNNTIFSGQNVGPSSPYSPDYSGNFPPASWTPFKTTYTSWWWDAFDSGVAQILTDKAKEDGLIGSSTNIELYGDYSSKVVITNDIDEEGNIIYRFIDIGDVVPFTIGITYFDKPNNYYVWREYLVNDLTYKGYTEAQSHLATLTWYDSLQPDGTYWSINNIEATLNEYGGGSM